MSVRWLIAASLTLVVIRVPLPVAEVLADDVEQMLSAARFQRQSTDRDADLLDVLLKRSMFVEAHELCQLRYDASSNQARSRVWWLAAISRVQTAEKMVAGVLDDESIAALQKPLIAHLQEYPDDPYRFHLQSEVLSVLRSACTRDVIAASADADPLATSDRALKRSARVVLDSEQLLNLIVQEQQLLDSGTRSPVSLAASSDLGTLAQRIRIDVARMLLMLSDLPQAEAGTPQDAAVKSLRFIDTSLETLSTESAGRSELQLLRIESILRTGSADQALEEWEEMGNSGLMSEAWNSYRLALRLRIALVKQEWSRLERELQAYYGDRPAAAPGSLEMDLLRFRYLIALNQLSASELQTVHSSIDDPQSELQQWLTGIESRHGTYARCQAEALMLSAFRRQSGRSAGGKIQTTIIAAQGAQWLRRGEPRRAGELLAATALDVSEFDQAMEYATKSAAAFSSANDLFSAASILYQTAIRFPNEERAATLAVQSIVLLGKSDEPRSRAQMEPMVRESIVTWSEVKAIGTLRDWFAGALTQQQRFVDAAEIAMTVPPKQWDLSLTTAMVQRWQDAVANAGDEELDGLEARFENLVSNLETSDNLWDVIARSTASAWGKSRASLPDVELPVTMPELDQRLRVSLALLKFRALGTVDEILREPNNVSRTALMRRLLEDARRDANLQSSVAALILGWDSERTGPTLDALELLIWANRRDEAVAMAEQIAAKTSQPSLTIPKIAKSFGAAANASLRLEGVRWWDELASGLPRGDRSWHAAKLESIDQLLKERHTEEAVKRARYVLLTQPTTDEDLASRYRAILEQNGSP